MTARTTTAKPRSHLKVVYDDCAPIDFERVYDQYYRYVSAVCLRLLGDNTDVDDVVQEIFWDCFNSIHKLRDMTHARRWLMQVTIRKTRKLLRRRKIAAFLHLPLIAPIDPPLPTASADDRAAVVQLFGLLEAVPVNHRLAWSLRYLEGANLREVAEACDCSLATAKRWIAKTQKVLTGACHE